MRSNARPSRPPRWSSRRNGCGVRRRVVWIWMAWLLSLLRLRPACSGPVRGGFRLLDVVPAGSPECVSASVRGMRQLWPKLGGQLGSLCIALGFIVILLGWNGAAGVDFTQGQIPYLLSGGAFGL